MENKLAITNTNDATGFANGMISSISADTQDERLEIFAKVSDCESLSDHVGEILNIQDVIIQPVEVEDPATGEMVMASRIVVVDDKGDAYGTVSKGVETAMRNLFAIVGNPSWVPALPMKVVQKKGRRGFNFTTLEYATETNKAKK